LKCSQRQPVLGQAAVGLAWVQSTLDTAPSAEKSKPKMKASAFGSEWSLRSAGLMPWTAFG
jgi:hypothetical protein